MREIKLCKIAFCECSAALFHSDAYSRASASGHCHILRGFITHTHAIRTYFTKKQYY